MIKDLKNVNLLSFLEIESSKGYPTIWWKSQSYYVYPFSVWKKRKKSKHKKLKKHLLHRKFVYWINYFFKESLKKSFKQIFYSFFYLGSIIFRLNFKKYLYLKKIIFWDFLNELDIKFLFFHTTFLKNLAYYNFGLYYLFLKNVDNTNVKLIFEKLEDFFFELPQKTIKLIDNFEFIDLEKENNFINLIWFIFLTQFLEFYKINIFFIFIK